jgi:hypothetical protein
MVGEVLQWVMLVVLAVLVLGVLRQVSLMLPPPARAAPSGPALGRRLPRQLVTEIERVIPPGGIAENTVLAFITESCVACQELLANLDGSGDLSSRERLVLVAKAPSPQFRGALMETGVATVCDEKGEIWEACKVTSTPLLVRINSQGRVLAKEVTHRVESVAANA